MGIRHAAHRQARSTAIAAKHELIRQITRTRLRGVRSSRDISSIAVVTALQSNNGIARGAQLQHAALTRASVPTSLVDASASTRSLLPRIPHEPASAYVFHSGVPETTMLVNGMLPEAARAWRIGYWAWELLAAPAGWRRYTTVVSEVWTPSQFVADSLTPLFDGPVRVVPHVVPPEPMRRRDTAQPFTVLTMADSRSSFARKNPLAAVQAFDTAFGNSTAARLIVKLNGRPADISPLASALRSRPNVTVVARFLDAAGLDDLYRSADVLLSLHRAEGFGLPLLEAMARGVPVVGTGWSGNTEFMTTDNSLLVPYRLVPVHDPSGIYRGGQWAEPDADVAAELLNELSRNPALYERIARSAHETVAAATLSEVT